MKFEETKIYLIDGRGLNYIASVMQRLYKSHAEQLGADELLTMANGLNAHLNAADRYYPPVRQSS